MIQSFAFFSLVLAGFLNSAEAQPLALPTPHPKLEEIRKLQHCFALFTGERIPPAHSLMTEVESGSKTGTTACMDVLSAADLNEQNQISSTQQELGTKILTQFMIQFRSQMSNPDASALMLGNVDLFDVNESAYHWLYSIFKPNEPVKNVITRNTALRSIRQTATQTRVKSIRTFAADLVFTQGYVGSGFNIDEPLNPSIVPTGKLIGVGPDTVMNPTKYLHYGHYSQHFPTLPVMSILNLPTNSHFGAGMLGSQTYNHGNNNLLTAANGERTARAWARNVLRDTLCIEVPSLQSFDVITKVKNDSNLPWIRGVSCQTCHVTLDGLAGVNRNLVRLDTSNGAAATFWYKIPVSASASPLPEMSSDSEFSKRPPNGRLIFRNYKGIIVNLELNDLSHLGTVLSEQDDFYACTAKKVFRQFTGIDVNLSKLNDLLNPVSLNPTELHFRNLVIAHGQKLKQTQSLKGLIQDIIQSPYFLHPDQGVIK